MRGMCSMLNDHTHPDQPILGLELFLRCLIVIDQRKSGAPSSTKLGAETKGHYAVLVRLVQSSELLGELRFGDIGAGRMEDIKDELTAGQETIGNEFARAQSDRCRAVGL